MKKLLDDVREFHRRFNVPHGYEPHVISEDRIFLRIALIEEEHEELQTALRQMNSDGDMSFECLSDGMADLIYVIVGAALEFGIPLDRVWDEVHRANMRKIGGGLREDGKILKPEGWQPPDIKGALWPKQS